MAHQDGHDQENPCVLIRGSCRRRQEHGALLESSDTCCHGVQAIRRCRRGAEDPDLPGQTRCLGEMLVVCDLHISQRAVVSADPSCDRAKHAEQDEAHRKDGERGPVVEDDGRDHEHREVQCCADTVRYCAENAPAGVRVRAERLQLSLSFRRLRWVVRREIALDEASSLAEFPRGGDAGAAPRYEDARERCKHHRCSDEQSELVCVNVQRKRAHLAPIGALSGRDQLGQGYEEHEAGGLELRSEK